ncbi:LptF/LptG family permease [Candidatus Pelagibacter sp. RS40]|uniref:LptF/LptG family permease n=1 Tax=Candidatus Pelagibacter sp. RS40 TaxID=1977865 RepID=UPI000A1549A5|nr:LptF/LptG family permease [Candidatus Pelagibacter sp. RS40]ARJ48669.1 hypothetical protein B8063_01190 [Candidatus Pelagibacter sp. RS40]
MLKKYHLYISAVFLKKITLISLIFLCLTIIINFFEELKFLENYDVKITYPILLTILNSPSVLFELFPFIFLISVKFFHMHLNEKNEFEILKNHGINNSKIILFLSINSIICGIFVIFIFYTFSSSLKNQYLILKNKFSSENEYLAVVNENGLWIKEEINNYSNIIHASKFNKNMIENITITQRNLITDKSGIIIAKSADISSKDWLLNNVKIINDLGENKKKNIFKYNSSFDGELISGLFSNLSSLNIYQLNFHLSNYKKIGYSTTDVKVHLNKIYSAPIFYLLMTILGILIMMKFTFIKTKFFTVITGIFVSVFIYYINYFSSLFGANETIPITLSIWLPHLILFLTCLIGVININEN